VWRPINLTLHVCWAMAILVLLKDYHFVDPTLYDAVAGAKEREIFSLAAQLGRLDFLNSVLAMLAIVIGLGAIIGIIEVRKGAEQKAEDVAIKAAEKIAKDALNEQLPSMVARAVYSNMNARMKLGENDTSENDLAAMMQAFSSKDDQNGAE